MRVTTTDHKTPLGTMWSAWTDRGLYSLNWEQPDFETVVASSITKQRIDLFRGCLAGFFQTGQESFSEVAIDPTGWTQFTFQVYRHCRRIAPATTLTYKQLAELAGNQQASRAVGAAMSRNRLLLVIPCHRVIAAGGGLRGFSAPGGLATKRLLLELERERCWPTDLFADAPA